MPSFEPATKRSPYALTYEDYAGLPDDGLHYELIDGELLVTPSPVPLHQRVARQVYDAISPFVKRKRLGELFWAPLDVLLGPHTVVQPDVFFIVKARIDAIVGPERVEGSPDLVVEVLSRGTAKRDSKTKRALYRRHGVAHYWIIDPLAKTLVENVLEGRRYVRRSFRGNAKFKPACFRGLTIDLAQLWES